MRAGGVRGGIFAVFSSLVGDHDVRVPREDGGPGLADGGRSLARGCAEQGILVDVSHLDEAGFWDFAGLELGPIVATHSAAHSLCAASRNLTDAQLDMTGSSGGLVGIVFAC